VVTHPLQPIIFLGHLGYQDGPPGKLLIASDASFPLQVVQKDEVSK